MKNYEAKDIRNIGLYSHGGVGKTSLAEAMLYNAKATDRLGSVDKGNTVCDFDPDEIERKISINSALAPFEWKGLKINLIDTPGFMDFVGEVIGSLRVVEGGILLLSAVAGVEVGTELVWEKIEAQKLPRLIFVNGMDKENANFEQALDKFRDVLSKNITPIHLPIGSSSTFKGIVDIIKMKAFIFDESGAAKETDIPGELQEQAEQFRMELMEKVAENDEALMEKYLDEGQLSEEEIIKCFKIAFKLGDITPVTCGSAVKNIGITTLMDLCINTFPSPLEGGKINAKKPSGDEIELNCSPGGPMAALVFKTTADPFVGKLSYFRVYSGVFSPDCTIYNSSQECEERITKVYYMKGKNQEVTGRINPGDIAVTAKLQAVTGDTLCTKENAVILEKIEFPKPVMIQALKAKSKADEDKLTTSVSRLVEEDPTLISERNIETRQLLLSGMGELHLLIVADRLKRKFGVNVELDKPIISYRETIKSRTQAEGKHKKQSGGRGQFGHVWLELAPLPREQHFEFVNKIVGGVVPKNYIPAVEKGVISTMQEGIVAGYPVTSVQATIYDGSYHTVDSSDIAFQLAARLAFRKGMEQASPVLLEPIMNVEIVVPGDYMGDVMGDLNSKRGRILGMDPVGKKQIIKALVPHGEMLNYCIDLRSITQGRGRFSMEFSHYEEVPSSIADAVIEQAKKAKEEQQQ